MQGPPDSHYLGGQPLANWAAHRSNPASAHPGHQRDLVSAHPGQQPQQGPSLLHSLQQRGVPLEIFCRGTTRQRAPIRASISIQGSPTRATSPSRAPPYCTPRCIGGDSWQKFCRSPRTNTIRGVGEQSTRHHRGQGLERTRGGAHSHSGRGNNRPQPPCRSGNRPPNPLPNHHRDLREGAGHRRA